MTSAIRLQALPAGDRGYEPRTRLSLALRRAAVLSFEQLAAGPGFLRRVVRPVAVMPAPSARAGVVPQLSAEELARDPLAYPVAPVRPERAAKPVFKVVVESVEPIVETAPNALKLAAAPISKTGSPVVEPVEPAAEPRHRGSLHGGNENPVRSMLSPSQRAALRRPETRLDRDGRSTYITYTVDTTGKS